jgi:hypothetical protein
MDKGESEQLGQKKRDISIGAVSIDCTERLTVEPKSLSVSHCSMPLQKRYRCQRRQVLLKHHNSRPVAPSVVAPVRFTHVLSQSILLAHFWQISQENNQCPLHGSRERTPRDMNNRQLSHQVSRQLSRPLSNVWSTAILLLTLLGISGCDSEFDLVLTPGADYSTAVGTYSAIMVSADGDVDDPIDIPAVKIKSVNVKNNGVLTATADNSLQRVLVYAKTAGRSKITIETDLGTERIRVTVVESDGITYIEDAGIKAHLPPPKLWMIGGVSDLAFTWTSQGRALLGANVAQLNSSSPQMMTVVPYSSFEDVNLATVHFYQTGTVLLNTPGTIPDVAFEIVDDTRVHHIDPVYLADTESGFTANTSEDTLRTDVKKADWWRVVAYSESNDRIGGLDGALDVQLIDSPQCGFDVIGDEFMLYRETPGICTVHIAIGTFQQTVSYTYH